MAQISVLQRNDAVDSFGNNVNSGLIRIYSGTPPANPDTALSGNTVLVELTLAVDAFPAASSGTAAANAIPSVTASATGTATFFRVLESDGSTVRAQGTVGTSGTDMVLTDTSITSGGNVTINTFNYSQPE